MDIIPDIYSKSLTKDNNVSYYLLIVYACSKLTKLYVMENVNTEEFMDKLDMSQTRFGKVDEFGFWYMEIIQTDYSIKFDSKEFQGGLSVCGVRLLLAVPYHQ